MTISPKRARASQRPTSPKKSNTGRKPGRQFTETLYVQMRPEDSAVLKWLMARLNEKGAPIVRAALHREKLRIEEADAEKNNAEK